MRLGGGAQDVPCFDNPCGPCEACDGLLATDSCSTTCAASQTCDGVSCVVRPARWITEGRLREGAGLRVSMRGGGWRAVAEVSRWLRRERWSGAVFLSALG